MGQSQSSGSSLKSRRSTESNSLVQEFSSVVKFAHTNTLQEENNYRRSRAHKAFKRLIENSKARKKRKVSKGATVINREMANFFSIRDSEVANIQRAWPKIEPHLLPIGIRMFISILESRCEKMPVCKQKVCCNNPESKKNQGCPTQVMLNEELQKFVLLLMGIIRRTVKHIGNPNSVVKILSKCSRKHFRKLNFDLSKLDPDPLSKHFCNSVREIITHSSFWNSDMEKSYIGLIKMIIIAMQKLATTREFDEEGDDDSEDCSDGEESLPSPPTETAGTSSTKALAPFDKHLVLYGCQTFQDFFEAHPHMMDNFDQYQDIFLTENLSASEVLKLYATKVLSMSEDIMKSDGNPEKIKSLMKDLGEFHYDQGVGEQHLEMLGPIVCHTVRPIVFKTGLWSIEVEKSWNHMFDVISNLMRAGYPGNRGLDFENPMNRLNKLPFPSLTHVMMLKDTWKGIVEHMHELGLTAVVKLFKINYNFKFYTSPKVRYRPQARARGFDDSSNSQNSEHLSVVFNLIVSIVDQVIAGLPNLAHNLDPSVNPPGTIPNSVLQIKQMEQLREPFDWIGPVFCNTVRPLLLVQGKWSYQVEMSWLMLFRQLVKKQHTTERMTRRERYT